MWSGALSCVVFPLRVLLACTRCPRKHVVPAGVWEGAWISAANRAAQAPPYPAVSVAPAAGSRTARTENLTPRMTSHTPRRQPAFTAPTSADHADLRQDPHGEYLGLSEFRGVCLSGWVARAIDAGVFQRGRPGRPRGTCLFPRVMDRPENAWAHVWSSQGVFIASVCMCLCGRF